MASDFEKPDKIHTLFPDEIQTKMWPLPIGDLYGCGKQTSARLSELGMKTIGDVAKTDQGLLKDLLGIKQGEYIYRSCNGYGSSHINPYEEDAKSYSNETTTRSDINFSNYEKEMPGILKWLSESVSRRLQRDGVFASTVSVSIKTDSFQRRSKQVGLGDSTNDQEVLLKTSLRLMDELVLGENGIFAQGFSIRLVGVGASDLDKGEYRQMSLFDLAGQGSTNNTTDADRAEKQRKLRQMTKDIEKRFGEGVIHKGRK
jgi:DNA polymerase-4